MTGTDTTDTPPDLTNRQRADRFAEAKAAGFDANEIRDARAFEQMLRDLGFSRRFSAAVTAAGFKAALGQRDAGEDPALSALAAEIRACVSAIRDLRSER